jgi:hypothetical protein
MLIRDNNSTLELKIEDKMPEGVQGAGDFALRSILNICITGVETDEFMANARSWIDIVKFNRFLNELKSLETSRQGSAEIESMSPGEFRIRFYKKNSRGEIEAEGEVGRHLTGSSRMNKVHFEIAIDPTSVKAILEDFKLLPSS